jgi:hypothetical protein
LLVLVGWVGLKVVVVELSVSGCDEGWRNRTTKVCYIPSGYSLTFLK